MLANFRHVDAVLRSVSALIVFGLALGGHATAQPADLYDFTGGPADGRAGSVTSLATGPDGNLYGTSQCGGNAVTDPCTGGYGAISHCGNRRRAAIPGHSKSCTDFHRTLTRVTTPSPTHWQSVRTALCMERHSTAIWSGA